MIFLPRVLSFLILALCAIRTIALAQEHTPLEIPEALSANSVGNMEYRCGLNHGLTIPLRNGLYSAEVPYLPQRPLTMSANLAALAHGDLDADSTPDAAVVYIYNTGGTGQYYMLSILQGRCRRPQGERLSIPGRQGATPRPDHRQGARPAGHGHAPEKRPCLLPGKTRDMVLCPARRSPGTRA